MNEKERENPEELFGAFYDGEQARQAAEDLRAADAMLGDFDTAEPDDELIADIKRKIRIRLAKKKAKDFRAVLLRAVAVAAVFLIAALILVRYFKPADYQETGAGSEVVMLSNNVWESVDLVDADEDLFDLSAAIMELESELYAVDSEGALIEDEIEEYEYELMDTENDFWKG
jgi:hypothetical protein